MKTRFNSGDEILEFIVRDQTGSKIEVRRVNKEDSEEGGRIIRWLVEKWGWHPRIKKGLLEFDEFLSF